MDSCSWVFTLIVNVLFQKATGNIENFLIWDMQTDFFFNFTSLIENQITFLIQFSWIPLGIY